MQGYTAKRIAVVVFLLIIFCVPVYSKQGGYVVKPYVIIQNNTTLGPADTKGADATISFWDEPLWIKIAYAIQLFAVAIISFKVVPIILEKIKKLRDTEKSNVVLGFISKKPGSTMSGISKGTGISRDTVKYHVYNLISIGRVNMERIGKYSMLFLKKYKRERKARKVLVHLNIATRRKMVNAIMESSGVTNVELAQRLNLDKSTIHWHIDKLIRDGIVVFEKEGIYKKYYLTIDAEELLRELNADLKKVILT